MNIKHVINLNEYSNQFSPKGTMPVEAFRVRPNLPLSVLSGMGTILNKIQRSKSSEFVKLVKENPEAALDHGFCLLSDKFPGFYFGLIREDEEGYLIYGWLPNGMNQHNNY